MKNINRLGQLHKNHVLNKNFRNNQNYIISDYWRYKFYKYHISKKFDYFLFIIFSIMVILFILWEYYNDQFYSTLSLLIFIFTLIIYRIYFFILKK